MSQVDVPTQETTCAIYILFFPSQYVGDLTTKALKIVREIDSVVFPKGDMLFSRCFLIWMESLYLFPSKKPRSPKIVWADGTHLSCSPSFLHFPCIGIQHLPHESWLYSFRYIPTMTGWLVQLAVQWEIRNDYTPKVTARTWIVPLADQKVQGTIGIFY